MDKSSQEFTESYCREYEHFTSDNVKLIGDCLRFYADTQGNKYAVVFASSDGVGPRQVVTFKDLYEKALTTAQSLIAMGIKPGEIVAVDIRPCPEWLFLTFESLFAGARVAGITISDGNDLALMMEKLQKCALLALDHGVDGNNWKIVLTLVESFNQEDGKASSKEMPYLRYLIGHEFSKNVAIKSVQDLLNENKYAIDLPMCTEDDIAVLYQTSGSTGVPKLVAHTHKSLLYPRKLQNFILFDKNHIFFCDGPFNWMGGFPLSIFVGQTRVTISGFGPPAEDRLQRVVDVISEERCTLAVALPPMLDAMINVQDRLPPNWFLESIMTGGQPLSKNLSQCMGKICKTLTSAYGATEVLYMCTKHVIDRDYFTEFSCGRPILGGGLQIKVVNENGQTVSVNTRGEVLVKTPAMFKEYFNDPVKTSAVFDDWGWFRTGDMGKMTKSGEIYIDGRKANMIMSGGMAVAPEMIERVIKACPGVEAAVIVPVPDFLHYQVLCACVIIGKGSLITEKDLRAYCEGFDKDKPGIFAVLPRYYLFVHSFPQTTTGKTSRKLLQEKAKQTFSHSANKPSNMSVDRISRK